MTNSTNNALTLANLPGGFGGGEPTGTLIDLRKPGDVQLVLRAIANRWNPSEDMRRAMIDQIDGAIEHYCQKMTNEQGRCAVRAINQFLKLAKLMVAMVADDMLADWPRLRTVAGMPRRRYPERRRQRRAPARRIDWAKVEAILAKIDQMNVQKSKK